MTVGGGGGDEGKRGDTLSLLPHLLVYESDQCIFVHCCNKIKKVNRSTLSLRLPIITAPSPIIHIEAYAQYKRLIRAAKVGIYF